LKREAIKSRFSQILRVFGIDSLMVVSYTSLKTYSDFT